MGNPVITVDTVESWILLVEDSPADRELAVHALRRGNFGGRIEEAQDGVEAMDRLLCRGRWSDRDPDDLPRAIFLDIKMPRVNGIEVLGQLKRSKRWREIPVVMLTSSAEESDLGVCYALGVNSYVVKPVDSDEFFRSLLDLGRYWIVLNRLPTERTHLETSTPADR